MNGVERTKRRRLNSCGETNDHGIEIEQFDSAQGSLRARDGLGPGQPKRCPGDLYRSNNAAHPPGPGADRQAKRLRFGLDHGELRQCG